MSIALAIILTPGVLALGVLAYSLVVRRPRVWTEPARDALILAAHPDDCVIIAGEYAAAAVAEGRNVQVVYLTCGDELPGSARAQTRRAEAIQAWQSLGVPADQLHFLDLSESPVTGPSRICEQSAQQAMTALQVILRRLPAHAAMFVPAGGEAHVDHVMLRAIALKAVQQAQRTDVIVLESPEYHPYRSLYHAPRRTILEVVGHVPVVCHLVGERTKSMPYEFAWGSVGMSLPPNPDRLEKKKQALRMFESENGALLVQCFGQPDVYRQVDIAADAAEREPAGYISVGGRRLGVSVVALWVSIWGIVGWCLARLVAIAASYPVHPAAVTGFAVLCGVVLVVHGVRKRVVVETRLLYMIAGVGSIAGAL